ncbi:MAG: hypothetical protein ACR2RL_22045 [Gammaproteobacteria bacterium]
MKSGRLTLALLVSAVVLGAVGALAHLTQPTGVAAHGARADAGASVPGAAGPDAPVDVQAPSLPSLASLDQTIQRPLFSATRRPPEPVKPEGAPTSKVAAPARDTPLPATELSAVVMYGDTRVALLKTPAGGGLIRKQVGEEVEGWRLESIDSLNVLLQNGANRHRLQLRTFKQAPLRRTPSTVDKRDRAQVQGKPDRRRAARNRASVQEEGELDPEDIMELEDEDPELLDAELEAEAERVREAIERRRERRAQRAQRQ